MAFHVPEPFEELYDQVVDRFRMLLRRGVVTGITPIGLDRWLNNFASDQDRYLAARLLENLTFRSERMVASAIAHLCECLLPCELRRLNIGKFQDVDQFVESLESGGADHPVRFVAVDGAFDDTPGKSGAVIIREFQRHGPISKSLTCKPESLGASPASVRCLVFVDDMLGTGTQFTKFEKHYNLRALQPAKHLMYCPLVAHEKGLAKLKKDFPWLSVLPVEQFGTEHQFYRPLEDDAKTWAIDGSNVVDDVRLYVKQLCALHQIPATTHHSLSLLLGFQHATPNNTLPILYAKSSTWQNLLIRQT